MDPPHIAASQIGFDSVMGMGSRLMGCDSQLSYRILVRGVIFVELRV